MSSDLKKITIRNVPSSFLEQLKKIREELEEKTSETYSQQDVLLEILRVTLDEEGFKIQQKYFESLIGQVEYKIDELSEKIDQLMMLQGQDPNHDLH